MSNDITITFDDIIKQYRTLDLSEDIFRSMMAEDKQLQVDDFIRLIQESQEEEFKCEFTVYRRLQIFCIWDSLDDHDE